MLSDRQLSRFWNTVMPPSSGIQCHIPEHHTSQQTEIMKISPVFLSEWQSSTIFGPYNAWLRVTFSLTWYLNGASPWRIHVVGCDHQSWSWPILLSKVLGAAVSIDSSDNKMCACLLEPYSILGSTCVQPRVRLLHMLYVQLLPCNGTEELIKHNSAIILAPSRTVT